MRRNENEICTRSESTAVSYLIILIVEYPVSILFVLGWVGLGVCLIPSDEPLNASTKVVLSSEWSMNRV